jgi:2C-methyl-D-erythritol 2,4-cyclodiphosphate synthase
MPKINTKQSQLQQRLAECERGARLIKGLFEAGDDIPDFITDAVMDALDAAAGFTGVEHFGETDFNMDGLASLLLVTRNFDLRHSHEGLAFHVAAVLNNPKVPTDIYNTLSEGVSDLISGPVSDSALSIALHLRAHEAREGAKVV